MISCIGVLNVFWFLRKRKCCIELSYLKLGLYSNSNNCKCKPWFDFFNRKTGSTQILGNQNVQIWRSWCSSFPSIKLELVYAVAQEFITYNCLFEPLCFYLIGLPVHFIDQKCHYFLRILFFIFYCLIIWEGVFVHAKLIISWCLNRWVEEYQIDGFQFHSLSSMIYTHNGFASFTGDLEE